jgi:hypothetical protein
MLPEQLRLLISAYADGDLSPRRHKAAARLLKHSAEARKLLTDLQSDSRQLRALPPQPLPADFAERVVNALPVERPIIRLESVPRPNANRLSLASRVTVAAAVLIAVVGGAWLFRSLPTEPTRNGRDLTRRTAGEGEAVATASRIDADEPGSVPADPPPPKPEPVTQALPDSSPPMRVPESPRPVPSDVLGNRPSVAPTFVRVTPPALVTLPVRGLDDQALQKLRLGLANGDAHRIDLFCRDTAKAFERLRAACTGRGVHLVMDPVAQDALKRKLQSHYVLYCDDLTADQWQQLVRTVSTADARAEQKRAGDGLFEQLVVMPLSASDQKELTTLLGADPTLVANRPRTGPAVGVEGVSASNQSAREKLALVVPSTPLRPVPLSREIRQFLDGQRERAPGTIAVMLLLRSPP